MPSAPPRPVSPIPEPPEQDQDRYRRSGAPSPEPRPQLQEPLSEKTQKINLQKDPSSDKKKDGMGPKRVIETFTSSTTNSECLRDNMLDHLI
ncbi:hypothetical protein Daesc_001546 [Daldinia eschscholtzii]|uniref:Uncharacterized protein n=1 Tax=Daldinia eschscholtzii TaxID=292717 RepID=A0AAX6MVQ9_9PEZI